MTSAKQNRSIARLIVGAMTIDGSLDSSERAKVVETLQKMGLEDLIADMAVALDEDPGDFNMFQECQELIDSLGESQKEVCPMVFRLVAEVIASDRFVSSREAGYLSALSRRLGLTTEVSKSLLKQVMAERRGRLEMAGNKVNEAINPHLKEMLSFQGAEQLVGELDDDSIEELTSGVQEALAEGERVSRDDLQRALAILGLATAAKLSEAEAVWRQTIDDLNLPKMAGLGETYVTAAINRISKINEAYKTVLRFCRGGKAVN